MLQSNIFYFKTWTSKCIFFGLWFIEKFSIFLVLKHSDMCLSKSFSSKFLIQKNML